MNGFIKYFEKNSISFLTDDDDVIFKYNQISKKINKLLSVKFSSQSVYDEKYFNKRAKMFQDKVIAKFTDNEILKENTHYSCTASTCVDSLIKLEKETYVQVSLQQCKFRLKKKKTLIYLMMN